MLGLPSIAMVGFALAALVMRHWRYRIHRAARRNAISPNQVHLALDPARWSEHGEGAHARRLHPEFREALREPRRRGGAAVDLRKSEEQAEAEFVSINCEPEDSAVRAARRR